MSEVAQLIERIRAHHAAHDHTLPLDGGALSIEPILNWGGFVNRSFRVSDERTTCFLKLTSDSDVKRGLQRWRKCADVLAARYHAPEMRGWLDLDDSYCGPLFEWIEGSPAPNLEGHFADSVCAVVQQLHGDTMLAERLAEDGSPVESCARAYLRIYNERFVEDLAFVDSDPPPFVGPELRSWLREQAGFLERAVRDSLAFQEAADQPVHADLWLNNTLVDRSGRWYLLDWDGLSLGDPVIDWCMLFGPTHALPREPVLSAVTRRVDLKRDEQERLRIHARAALLDWVIDPLADWVGAAQEPEHGAQVRAANERIHTAALQRYRLVYGS